MDRTVQTRFEVPLEPDNSISGIDISRMAAAALAIDDELPLKPSTFDEIVTDAVFRTTEYAIRGTAPDTPDQPADPTEPTANLDHHLEDDGPQQTTLEVIA